MCWKSIIALKRFQHFLECGISHRNAFAIFQLAFRVKVISEV